MTESITIKRDSDGIALLTIDVPGKSMNVLSETVIDRLDSVVTDIIRDDRVIGAVFTSGKAGAFVSGADLNMILRMIKFKKSRDADYVREVHKRGRALSVILRRMETCGKPFAVAADGLALGGGLEICLACHYRVFADDPKIKLGLPEVLVGLLPGGGGTQRLVRLMGVQPALPFLLQGRNMTPQQALANRVVDAVVPAADMVSHAKAWIKKEGRTVQPWDVKGFKIPGGQGAFNPGIAQTFMGAQAMVQKETRGNYPAPVAILSAVYEGHQLPMDQALAIESQYFTTLLCDDVALNMIRTLFIHKQAAGKGLRRPKDIAPQKVECLGILGAGMMGAGIAYVSALAGMTVILLDVTDAAAEKGKQYSESLLNKRVKRGKMTADKAADILSRIIPSTDYGALKDCDLVIEAVLEDPTVKADVTARTEAVVGEDCIYASNTSTLPISSLAQASRRPDQFIGIHFFSPVDKMPLVEIILGKKTDDLALARALDYVAQIRKTPIVVQDSRGFYTSRCFSTYVKEAITMLAEGVSPALIEQAGYFSGMAIGPFAVGDEVSIELMYHVEEATRKALGKAYVPEKADAVIGKLYRDLDRKGKKNRKGFYEYPAEGEKYLWPELAQHYPPAAHQPSPEEVKKRLLYRQALEVVRCYAEKVVMAPADADVGAVFGWGFPPHTGGPLSMIDTIGIDNFVAACDKLCAQYGPAFTVPPLLREKATKGEKFYD